MWSSVHSPYIDKACLNTVTQVDYQLYLVEMNNKATPSTSVTTYAEHKSSSGRAGTSLLMLPCDSVIFVHFRSATGLVVMAKTKTLHLFSHVSHMNVSMFWKARHRYTAVPGKLQDLSTSWYQVPGTIVHCTVNSCSVLCVSEFSIFVIIR
jgi:hypothetical protein